MCVCVCVYESVYLVCACVGPIDILIHANPFCRIGLLPPPHPLPSIVLLIIKHGLDMFLFHTRAQKKFTPFCQSITESICSLLKSAINRANKKQTSALYYPTSWRLTVATIDKRPCVAKILNRDLFVETAGLVFFERPLAYICYFCYLLSNYLKLGIIKFIIFGTKVSIKK